MSLGAKCNPLLIAVDCEHYINPQLRRRRGARPCARRWLKTKKPLALPNCALTLPCRISPQVGLAPLAELSESCTTAIS